jgi:serine protease Do
MAGEVIGINTAIVASGQGIGFSIPINMAREITDRLIAQGRVVRGWLGIGIQDLTEELATQFGVKPEEGVLVGNVMKDGPAERGGLKTGDIIQEFNGVKISNVRQLQREVAQAPINTPAGVRVLRERQVVTLRVLLGEQPAEVTAAPAEAPPAETAERFGFSVQELTPELREQLKLQGAGGVVVSGVEEGGPAGRAGVRAGDVITQVNREPVKGLQDFTQLLGQMRRGGNLLLLVQRDGGSRFVVLSPKK